jgi:Dehydrogenases with different specificities (related to short-chain alcohol dehydrogenases)
MENKNKVALITGANKGIGAAIAKKFASENYDIIIDYKEEDELAIQVKENLEKEYNVKILTIKSDISIEKEVKKMVDMIIKEFGTIDVLVNNAGIAIDKEFSERTLEDFEETFKTNVFGTFLVSKYVSEIMLKNKKGKIINISSTNGIDTLYPTSIDYDASKAAVISLTKNMAIEFAPYINVNSVAPGWVDTDMNKELPKDFLEEEKEKILLKRFAALEEVAGTVYFLTTKEAGYITGETIRVDGGM